MLSVAGCSSMPSWRSLGVYKLDINQGNYLTDDQVDRLRVGQTKQQVRAILGSPLLTDAFHQNRGAFVYLYRHQGVTQEQRTFAVFFEDDKVARWEGDKMPTSAVAENRSATEKSLKGETDNESGFSRWVKGIFGK